MKKLFNYCPVHGYEEEIANYPGGMKKYLADNNLDGLEIYVYGTEPFEKNYAKECVGAHLKFFPYWLDFYQGKCEEVFHQLGSREKVQEYYLGAKSKEEWLEKIRQNIRAALLLEPEYLVWHVADCNLEETFSFDFQHSDEEIIAATCEIINSLEDCLSEDVLLLFENLWWPGLRLRDTQAVEMLFRGIRKKKVGLMLDTGHLMNTNPSLRSEAEGISYIKETVNRLGIYKNYIKGIHLSCSLSGTYREGKSWEERKERTPEFIMGHIANIDQHKNFKEAGLKDLLSFLNPDYLVHELFYDNLKELAEFIQQQSLLLKK